MARKMPWQHSRNNHAPTPQRNKSTPTKTTTGETPDRDIGKSFQKSPTQTPQRQTSFSSSNSGTTKGISNRKSFSTRKDHHLSTDQEADTPNQSTRKRKRGEDTFVNGNRSPSSSPPPIRVPDAFSPMKAGYGDGGDDIYIMVEDEFHAIAQSYTAHLHQAEYRRLVKLARDRSPKILPEEVLEKMTGQRKMQLDREKRKKKIESGLDALLGNDKLMSTAGYTSDDEKTSRRGKGKGGDRERQKSNPWEGTSLASLMSPSKQRQMSLVGLEKIPSLTRASLGFDSRVEVVRNEKLRRRETSILEGIQHGGPRTFHYPEDHTATSRQGEGSAALSPENHPSNSTTTATQTAHESTEIDNDSNSGVTSTRTNTAKQIRRHHLKPRRPKVFDDGFDESLTRDDGAPVRTSRQDRNIISRNGTGPTEVGGGFRKAATRDKYTDTSPYKKVDGFKRSGNPKITAEQVDKTGQQKRERNGQIPMFL